MATSIPQGLDPTAFLLTKAIGQTEASGSDPYNTVGDNGTSIGRYQIQKSNWPSWAAKYLGNPNAAPTEENQNKLAYSKVSDLLSQGYTQSQIASIWNSGHPNPNTVGKGTNTALGVNYDVPAYVSKVQKNYEALQQGFNPNPYSNPSANTSPTSPGLINTSGNVNTAQPSQSSGLLSELGGRINDAGQAISNAVSGKINPLSGVIQTAGAVAGGMGDVVNAGLELIPGVKQLEGLIGQGVGSLAKSPVGKPVAQAIQNFSTAHPELAADIGAGFNIATAIPIFEGLSAVKDLAGSAIGDSLQNVAKKSVVDGTEQAMSTGKALSKNFINNGGRETVANAMDLVGKDGVPAIEGGKYSTQQAYENVGNAISKIEDSELQPLLQSKSTQLVADRLPLEQLRQETLNTVSNEFKASGNVAKAKAEVNRVFDDYKASYGDYVTLNDINDMKRGIRTSVNFNSPKLESDVTYHIGQTFQKEIENKAKQLGLGDVQAVNQKMGSLIKYQNMLKALDKTNARVGPVRGFLQHLVGTGAGAGIGAMVGGGLPGEMIGGYLGDKASGLLGKKAIGGVSGSFLKDTVENTAKKATTRKIAGLVGGALAQKSTQ